MKQARSLFVTATVASTVIASAVTAHAAPKGGCEILALPATTELSWMKADDPLVVTSAAKLAEIPAKAISVTLTSSETANLPMPPTRKPKEDAGKLFAGVVTFDNMPKAGTYQVSLSGPGWIDVVQEGKVLASGEHTSAADCDGIRKIVRFDIAEGPFAIMLSNVPSETIKLTLTPGL